MKNAGCVTRTAGQKKEAGVTVYLMEELGDARMRCDQLVRYITEAFKLIESSGQREQLFEVGGHLIHAIPDALFRLQKALQAVALAADRLDYEELKNELRPEKVQELERVLQEVRIRNVQHRSQPLGGSGSQDMKSAADWKLSADDEKKSRFEEGKPADPTENMSEEDAKRWKEEHEKNKDNFKSAALSVTNVKDAAEKIESKAKEIQKLLAKGEVTDRVYDLFNDIRGTSSVMVSRIESADKNKSASALDWKADSAKLASEDMPDEILPNAVPGIERIVDQARKVGVASTSKKMFFAMLGVLDGIAQVGRTYEVPKVGLLMQVRKEMVAYSGARPTTNFSASEEDKRSKFEEGKPADPTENMSEEDAKKWKLENLKNKDNFKAAARRQLKPGDEEVVSIIARVEGEGADRAIKGFRIDSPMGQDYGFKTIEAATREVVKKAPLAVENILKRGTVAVEASAIGALAWKVSADAEFWKPVMDEDPKKVGTVWVRPGNQRDGEAHAFKEATFDDGSAVVNNVSLCGKKFQGMAISKARAHGNTSSEKCPTCKQKA